MKFSVLIPVYNVAEYLPQCLDSVLSQTFTDYEVIITDDGSTDDCPIICDRYADSHPDIIYVIHKENEGLISARRVGIDAAQGEYCVFVDSDDYIDSDLLEIVNSRLTTDIDMAIYSFRYYQNGKTEDRNNELFPDGTVFDKLNKAELYKRFLRTHDVTAIWIKAIKTSILQNDPMDYHQYYGKNMSEDILQSIYPLTAAEKIIYINKPLYNYRINEKSVSRSFTPETISSKNSLHVYNELVKVLPVWSLDNEEEKHRLYAKWFNTIVYTFINYYSSAATKIEIKELLDYPWAELIPNERSNRFCNKYYLKIYNHLIKKNTIVLNLLLKHKLISKIYKELI